MSRDGRLEDEFLDLALAPKGNGGGYAIAYALLRLAMATERVARALDGLLPSEKIYDLAGLLGKQLKEAAMLLPERDQ